MFTFPNCFLWYIFQSSSSLLPLLLRTFMWWYELLNLHVFFSFIKCLKLPAHDRWKWCSVSSFNCITKLIQKSEAFVHPGWKCIFKDVLTTDRFHTVSIIHTWLHSAGLQRNYVWYSKVETMQHWSWILYAVFCLCHMIEDKCWKHSFKQSMRLKCTARKECIKYINKSISLKSFVPKTIHTPCGNNETETLWYYVDRKDPIGENEV